ncbi:MAG: NAD-dependent epimerase/dehydratase family protein [bacterium]|nr:NAD-dependent epimerase/dehydratase family protein [bacterium]
MSRTVLVTGANGEIGHTLLETFSTQDDVRVLALDLAPLHDELQPHAAIVVQGDISDPEIVARLQKEDIDEVYHLAALLSTSAEKFPEKAHHVNVNGTLGLLSMARAIGERRGRTVTFMFPSTIAVYGLPSIEKKNRAGMLREDEFLTPHTMYGINKLYCERLGEYFATRYGQITEEGPDRWVDFRALRFPGLISAFTVPTGGTSDYVPEMIHAAAQGKPYECFVRPDTRIPFMAMPDAVHALLMLAAAPETVLTQRVYNIGAFAPSAEDVAVRVQAAFPGADISYEPNTKRQAIVDSWCADVNDNAARKDWGWKAEYDINRAFDEYLIPNIAGVYAG